MARPRRRPRARSSGRPTTHARGDDRRVGRAARRAGALARRRPGRVSVHAGRGLGYLRRRRRMAARAGSRATSSTTSCRAFSIGDHLLGLTGEPRHRRSYLYDLATGERTRLFANNTLRTISPEYVWPPSANGRRLAIAGRSRRRHGLPRARRVRRRPGSTRDGRRACQPRRRPASPPRRPFAQRMTQAFAPIAATRQERRRRGSPSTALYEYVRTLVDFDSKYITQPGNARAIDYLERTYRSFGYTPELQWFTPAEAQGTSHRERRCRQERHDQPVGRLRRQQSLRFGAGRTWRRRRLLGHGGPARNRAHARGHAAAGDDRLRVVHGRGSRTPRQRRIRPARGGAKACTSPAALNNDMIGWARTASGWTTRCATRTTASATSSTARRFSSPTSSPTTRGTTRTPTRRRSTTNGATSSAGLGSYPVLANPNYHQSTDRIETVDFQQVAETAKVTAATLMYLASSPARLDESQSGASAGRPERLLARRGRDRMSAATWSGTGRRDESRHITSVKVTAHARRCRRCRPARIVAVKAVMTAGVEGWDWARIVIQ